MDFLERVYSFQLPDLDTAPIVPGRLGPTYINGSIMAESVKAPYESTEDY
jgi:hypothetical protein